MTNLCYNLRSYLCFPNVSAENRERGLQARSMRVDPEMFQILSIRAKRQNRDI